MSVKETSEIQAEKFQAEKSQTEKSQTEKPQTEKPQAEKCQAEECQAEKIQTQEVTFPGKCFAFFGEFSFWPSYHRGAPADVALHRGAVVRDVVDEYVDYVVFGDRRTKERTEAKKQAEKLCSQAQKALAKGIKKPCPQIIDERVFRELVRIDLTGKTFCFFGGFDFCGGEYDEPLLARMVETVGGIVTKTIDYKLDYIVFGNRRGLGKIAAVSQAKKLNADNAKLKVLDEEGFLEMVRTDPVVSESSHSSKMDFATFITQLHGTVDQGKLGRALKMLKGEAFKLYARKNDDHVIGVVRSQTGSSTVYASWLNYEGKYGCATLGLDECMGLKGTVCKHLLVLIVGLTGAGEMDAATAYAWLKSAQGKRQKNNEELVTSTFIEYKGAQVGEIDWRPTETIPEDYYAF